MTHDTRSQLAWLASDGLPQLALLITTRAPGTNSGARSVEPKPPLHLHPLALEQDVHATLVGWVRIAIEDGLADDWPHDATTSICQWLSGHAEALLQHEAGDEFADQVHDCWARVRSAIGERCEVRPACPTCGERLTGMDVDGRPATTLPDWRWAKCPGCMQCWTFDAGLQRVSQLQELTVPQWSEETRIPERTLRWRLKRAGVEPSGRLNGRPTYRRVDLIGASLTATG